MAMVKSTIKSAILASLNASAPISASMSDADLKNALADAWADAWIAVNQTQTITIPSGLVVVAGSATTQTNPAPIVITGGVS